MKKSILISGTCCASLLLSMEAGAANIRVPADQATVAAAVGVANPNDTIQVQNTFANTAAITINKNLTIVSTNAAYTVPTPGASIGALAVQGAQLNLTGLTIGGATGLGVPAIAISSGISTVSATNCSVSTSDDFGIQVFNTANGSTLNLTNTSVSNNFLAGVRFDGDCQGMTLNANGLTASNNGQDGLLFIFGTPGVLNNHTISVQNSTFSDNVGFGVALGQKPLTGTPAVVNNCTINGNDGSGIFIGWEADNAVEPSVFNVSNIGLAGNFRGVEMVFLENSTVNLDTITITGSAQFAIIGDWLSAGVTTPTTVNIDNVTATANTFDGVYAAQGNWHLNDSNFSSNGFGLAVPFQENGRTITATNCDFNTNNLAGVTIAGPQQVTLTDCRINGNVFQGIEAGINLTLATKEPEVFNMTVDGCEVKNNGGLGIWASTMDMDVDIIDSVVTGNTVTAFSLEEERGAIAADANWAVAVSMDRCKFGGGATQAPHVSGDTWSLTNCLFDEGAITPTGSAPAFEDSVFAVCGGATASATNCTVVDSTAGISVVRGINVVNGTLNLQNSIITAPNAAVELDVTNGVAGTVNHNIYQAASVGLASPGANSLALGTNPQYMVASTGVGTGNFRLLVTSPAKDVANSAIAPAVDIDRIPRPQGAGDDIGAYEYSTAPAGIGSWIDY